MADGPIFLLGQNAIRRVVVEVRQEPVPVQILHQLTVENRAREMHLSLGNAMKSHAQVKPKICCLKISYIQQKNALP